MFTQVIEDKCSHILEVGILNPPVQGNHTQQVFSRYRFGGGGQKPWWDANKKRFVTAQGAGLALDHHCPENVQNTNRLFQNTNRLFWGTLVGIMIIGILTIGILSLPRAPSLCLTTTDIVTATEFLARSLYQTPFFLFLVHHLHLEECGALSACFITPFSMSFSLVFFFASLDLALIEYKLRFKWST